MSDLLKDSIISVGEKAIKVISEYFENSKDVEADVDLEKVDRAFKMINNSTRILHMDQVRINTERGHALKLLRYLPNEKIKSEYIKLTNPKLIPLLEAKPNNMKKESTED